MKSVRIKLVYAVATLGMLSSAVAQERGPDGRARNPGLTGWCETPVADRKAELGCYTTAVTKLGVLPAQGALYWQLDTFADAAAAEASRGALGTVVHSHGKHWLFTIAEQEWRPRGGEHVATIGPLPVDRGVAYSAHYSEAIISSGFQNETAGHRHPGPEAWYILSGGQCLETPNGVMVGLAGQSMLAPEGWPMAISSFGPDTRRSVFMVLHRSDESFVLPVNAKADSPHPQWRPKGLCATISQR
ncbi:MAG: hypothetical protein ACJ8OJ_18405 [Povalibacter sp.]